MRNSNTKVRCEKRKLTKCNGIVKTYSEVQYAFADVLEKDSTIKEFISNFPLTDFQLTDGKYTTDFYCTTISGEIVVYECVFRKHLTKPLTAKLLDASRNYWSRRGVEWRLVIDAND